MSPESTSPGRRFLKGRLLFAMPTVGDPNFDRSIILVLEHAALGAMGVILNRPSELDLESPLPSWAPLAATPGVIFLGGPVQRGGVIGLARFARTPVADPGVAGPTVDGPTMVVGDLGVVDLSRDPDEIGVEVGAEVRDVRVFSGYAGWAPGQLEAEMGAGTWVTVKAEPNDALTPDPARLWRDVLRRQRGNLALLANLPPDPTLN